MTTKQATEKIQDQRRELSVAISKILGAAVPYQDMEDKEFFLVPARLIKDAEKAYRKIWRKP